MSHSTPTADSLSAYTESGSRSLQPSSLSHFCLDSAVESWKTGTYLICSICNTLTYQCHHRPASSRSTPSCVYTFRGLQPLPAGAPHCGRCLNRPRRLTSILLLLNMSHSAFFYGTLLHPAILRRVIGHEGIQLQLCPAILLVSHRSLLLSSFVIGGGRSALRRPASCGWLHDARASGSKYHHSLYCGRQRPCGCYRTDTGLVSTEARGNGDLSGMFQAHSLHNFQDHTRHKIKVCPRNLLARLNRYPLGDCAIERGLSRRSSVQQEPRPFPPGRSEGPHPRRAHRSGNIR